MCIILLFNKELPPHNGLLPRFELYERLRARIVLLSCSANEKQTRTREPTHGVIGFLGIRKRIFVVDDTCHIPVSNGLVGRPGLLKHSSHAEETRNIAVANSLIERFGARKNI